MTIDMQELLYEALSLPGRIEKAEGVLLKDHVRQRIAAENRMDDAKANCAAHAEGTNDLQRKAHISLATVSERTLLQNAEENEAHQRIIVERLKRRHAALLVVLPLLAAKGEK